MRRPSAYMETFCADGHAVSCGKLALSASEYGAGSKR